MRDIKSEIKSKIDGNKVLLFMKGTPQRPQCGFSAALIEVLESIQVPYSTVNVLEDGEIREGIKAFSNWPTIPQLYVGGQFLGGCDIVREMHGKGELEPLLKATVTR